MALMYATHGHPSHMLPIYWVTYVSILSQELNIKQQSYLKYNHSGVYSPHTAEWINTGKCTTQNRKRPLMYLH